ncbi:MAG: hypothetical protein ABIE55_00075 [Candidatus Aenigmatarchaeota archaeon]
MQFKKLAAITGSALMAGLSLVGPALATSVTALGNIADMVSVTDTVAFPLFVVGPNALPSDIAGGIGVAVNMASNAKTTSQVAVAGVSVGITGGVSMATGTNPLTTWDTLASSKQVLTATDLPDVLESSNYIDQASVAVPYSQYLTFTNAAANGQVVYETPSGGTAPQLGLKITGNNIVYTYLLSFTKQISQTFTGGIVANMVNSQLNILGKTWTITAAVAGTDTLALTLLSGKNAQTVTTDESSTYDVDGSTYTVSLVAVGTIGLNTAATLTVEGGGLAAPETVQILSGGTKTLSDGTLMGVTSIFVTTKTGAIDSAVVFLGADKLELQDTNVTDGTAYLGVRVNGVTLNDVTVSMTGTASTTALTLDNIQIMWTPTLEQFIGVGTSLTDPASKGFKIFFGGITPALDDTANRGTVTVTPSGTTAAVAFTTSDGQSLSQSFARSTAAGAGNIALTDAGSYALHLVEGAQAGLNQYVALGRNSLAGNAQNSFGHILRVLSLQISSSTTSSFQDVASGATLTVTGGNTTMYLDGQAYQVCVPSTAAVYFVWGTGATCTGGIDVGSTTIDVYPALMTNKGAWVAITSPVTITGLTNATAYTLNLPTGTQAITTGTGGTASANFTVGTAIYEITVPAAGTTLVVRATDNSGTTAAWTTPGVLIVEGLDESQVRNLVAVRVDSGASYNRAEVAGSPSFSGTVTSVSAVSGTTLNRYVDQFGTYVSYDSTAPGTFSASLPSTQALATVGVGSSPAPSSGTGAGTVTTETVLAITADVVRMANEITQSEKENNDLVLMGGPCINELVAELADLGLFPYSCEDWPTGTPFGRVEVIADAFGTGQTALVIAGTHGPQTTLAGRIVQTGFPGATAAQLDESSIEITGSVSTPSYDTV